MAHTKHKQCNHWPDFRPSQIKSLFVWAQKSPNGTIPSWKRRQNCHPRTTIFLPFFIHRYDFFLYKGQHEKHKNKTNASFKLPHHATYWPKWRNQHAQDGEWQWQDAVTHLESRTGFSSTGAEHCPTHGRAYKKIYGFHTLITYMTRLM